jgi:MOSC domain-containing protein YiiM
VVSIHTVRERDGVAVPLPEASVRAGYGIEGDWRSHDRSTRQLTLIEEEALLAVEQELGRPVPPGASRRQVVVRGLPLNATVGKTLCAGELLLAVTGLCDPCDNMERKIGPGARAALAGRGGICARVLRGGTLRVGDAVSLQE